MASRALRFGHGCAVHVGVDVGAGDVEVDAIHITFIMNTQYTGYLVPHKDKVQPGKCITGQLKLCVDYWLRNSDRGVINPFPCEVTNIYRCQLLRTCDDTTSMFPSSQTLYGPKKTEDRGQR